ncbi:MAG TPA: hypothetical protein DEA96_03505 [Leptospiraceae bacterium]|nr:hypothetical protein [Spirochaetaceae bacterium]HBS04007.1 hypothetical protein [Leptospiraceae bacterium]
MHNCNIKILPLLLFLISVSLPFYGSISAEEPAEQRLEQDVPFLDTYMHRIQFDFGIGYAIGKQNLMTETGPAWLINSAINSGTTGQPAAIPLGEGDENDYFPIRTRLMYSYGDRFDVSYYRNNVVRKFSRNTSPSVLFAFPGNSTYATSLFEGTRLLRYHYDQRLYDFGYYHRWTKDFRAGPIIGYQSVHESLTATYGSYTLRNSSAGTDPSLTTWANAGDVKLNYHLNGLVFGLGLKWDVLDFLRIKYQLYFMERSGTFEAAGPQLVNFRDINDAESVDLAGIYQSGRASDSGMMHRVEAEFRYCRLSATIGMEREDWTRTYSEFYGFQTGPLTNISQKSMNLGLGERSTKSKGYRTEFYVTLGMAFHLGDVNASRPEPSRIDPVTTPTETEKPEEPQEPEVTPDEVGEYLDKLYDTVKDEFNRKGIALEELENSFRALGFKMEKVKDEASGNTKEIVATIDGDLSFDTGSAKLTQKALQLIDQVAQGLVDNPDTVAKVHGHTDSVGAYRSNKILSLRRAEAVKNAMVERKGIAPARIIEVQGFADDRKLVNTMGPEAKNRRVEIRISYQK